MHLLYLFELSSVAVVAWLLELEFLLIILLFSSRDARAFSMLRPCLAVGCRLHAVRVSVCLTVLPGSRLSGLSLAGGPTVALWPLERVAMHITR